MVDLLKLFANLINVCHDGIVDIFSAWGYSFSDKELHFIIIAIIGILIFFFTQIIFKWLSKYSVTAISFIYTFTVLVVIVFVIEIQQKITNKGHMEFADIAYGLYGFLCSFGLYLFVRGIIFAVKWLVNKIRQNKT